MVKGSGFRVQALGFSLFSVRGSLFWTVLLLEFHLELTSARDCLHQTRVESPRAPLDSWYPLRNHGCESFQLIRAGCGSGVKRSSLSSLPSAWLRWSARTSAVAPLDHARPAQRSRVALARRRLQPHRDPSSRLQHDSLGVLRSRGLQSSGPRKFCGSLLLLGRALVAGERGVEADLLLPSPLPRCAPCLGTGQQNQLPRNFFQKRLVRAGWFSW